MNFFARLIRFLFLVVMVTWGFRLLGRLFSGLLQAGRTTAPAEPTGDLDTAHATRLVRDPVCGVHIAEVRAIPVRENGQLLHFCSLACRDTYLNSSKKLAATG